MMWIAASVYLWFTVTDVPSLEDLASKWIDPNAPVSTNLPEQLGGKQRDLAVINNFWGSVGIAPEGARPVDMFAINSLELPPFAGCGSNAQSMLFGCGRLLVNGQQSRAVSTQWQAHQAGRRGSCNATTTTGAATMVDVSSTTRMAFEVIKRFEKLCAEFILVVFTRKDSHSNVVCSLGIEPFACILAMYSCRTMPSCGSSTSLPKTPLLPQLSM